VFFSPKPEKTADAIGKAWNPWEYPMTVTFGDVILAFRVVGPFGDLVIQQPL